MKKENNSFLFILIPIILGTAFSYFTMLPASAQIENGNRTDSGEKGFLYVGNAKSNSISVIDSNKPGQERYWTANKTTSEQIDAYLIEGHSLLKIQRIGSGTDTRYNIMPA